MAATPISRDDFHGGDAAYQQYLDALNTPGGAPVSRDDFHGGDSAYQQYLSANTAPTPAPPPAPTAPPPAPSSAPLPPSAGPNPAASAPPAMSAGVDPSVAAMTGSVRQILVDQMNGLNGQTDINSPEVQPAISAYDTQSQRDQQAMRDQIAEQNYASGTLNTGGFTTQVNQAAEQAGMGRATFAGSQVAQVAQQKRQQLTSMLQIATQYGLTDQAQQIQAQIAAIDANLRQQGITNQLAEFGTTAGLQQQGITNQNDQANNALGYNYAALVAQMNRDALLAGLGTGG